MLNQRLALIATVVLLTLMAVLPAPSFSDEGKPGAAPTSTSPWGATLSSGISSSLYKFGDQSRVFSADFGLAPHYSFNRTWSIGASFGVSQSISNEERKTIANDGRAGLRYKGGALNSFTKWGLNSGFVLPLSKKSRINDSLYTAFSIAPHFSFDLKDVGLENLTPNYTLSLSRAFHKYTTSITGGAKKQYNVQNIFGLDYQVANKFSVSGSFSHSTAWTYHGTRSNSFGLGQSLGYQTSKNSSISVGHENGGDMLRSNGQDSNVSFINENSSSIYGSFGYSF